MTDEFFIRVGRIEPANTVLDMKISAFGKVRVLGFVPFDFESESREEILEKAEEVSLTALTPITTRG